MGHPSGYYTIDVNCTIDNMTKTSTVSDFIAESNEANWITPLGIPSSLNRLKSIDKGVDNTNKEKDRIADMGGGTGKLGRELAEKRPEAEVVTTDISQQAVEEAVKLSRHNENHRAVQRNGLNGLGYFSQVYAVNVLQDMDNPGEGLREVYDKLEEGGTAVVTVPGRESAEIFPQKATSYDENLNLPYIQAPVKVNEKETKYSQYVLPKEWMEEAIQEIGFEVEDGYPEKILSDPTGLPYMSRIIHEDYSPNIPAPAAYALEKMPSGSVRKAVDRLGKGPEVDLWVMEK
jgi:SAM-dependent methyltransferase